MVSTSGDSIRVVRPLFPVEGQGSSPMSPLQLRVIHIPKRTFQILNKEWHSRLPNTGGFYVNGVFFGGEYKNILFCVAGWSDPVTINLSKMCLLELRRFAIAPEAPKNTASRILSVMTKLLYKEMPYIWKLISYQDPSVHSGTIYKAAGWYCAGRHNSGGFSSAKIRYRKPDQSPGPKIRWEKQLRVEPKHLCNNRGVHNTKEHIKGLIDWNIINTDIQ